MSSDVGAVVIGRNEGDRLIRCLRSVLPQVQRLVYVDSGSSDGSVASARELGAEVVELDGGRPFTAARGRNAGLQALVRSEPELRFLQFLDGDCELREGWIEAARQRLASDQRLAVVFGRRRERFPAASPYNRLVDMEWNVAPGDRESCGGDSLMRVDALQAVGGFRESLIAGEEPELCLRLRRAGYRVLCLDREMTWHDAALQRFGQWWRRCVRAGHAFAEHAALHGWSRDRFGVRKVASILAWSLGLPLVTACAVWWSGPWALLLAGAYLLPWWRAFRWRRRSGDGPAAARSYASFVMLSKFAELQGLLWFLWTRGVRRRSSTLIEYKGASPGP